MCLSVMPLTGLEQCTRRDSKFKFWVHTLLEKTQSVSGPTGGGQYTHSVMWQLVNYECINCTHCYVTTVVILPFWFASLIHISIFYECRILVLIMPDRENHIFGMHVFCFVFLLVVLFWARYLIGSWSLIAQGYMLDLLGDVTSTLSSCQLSGKCVTWWSVCIKFLSLIRLLSLFEYMFPQWPDEATSVWKPAKACHVKIIILLCFQQFQTHPS